MTTLKKQNFFSGRIRPEAPLYIFIDINKKIIGNLYIITENYGQTDGNEVICNMNMRIWSVKFLKR